MGSNTHNAKEATSRLSPRTVLVSFHDTPQTDMQGRDKLTHHAISGIHTFTIYVQHNKKRKAGDLAGLQETSRKKPFVPTGNCQSGMQTTTHLLTRKSNQCSHNNGSVGHQSGTTHSSVSTRQVTGNAPKVWQRSNTRLDATKPPTNGAGRDPVTRGGAHPFPHPFDIRARPVAHNQLPVHSGDSTL